MASSVRSGSTDQQVKVREAVTDDAAAIVELCEGLRESLGDPSGHLTIEKLRDDAFGPNACVSVLVAQTDQSIIGYALYLDTYETAYAARGLYLADLYVLPAHRCQGAGRALVTAVTDEARRRKLQFVWWLAAPENEIGLAFYEKMAPVIRADMIAHAKVLAD